MSKLTPIFLVLMVGLMQCGTNPGKATLLSPDLEMAGSVRITSAIIRTASAPKLAKSLKTTWNLLFSEITAPDIDTLRDSIQVSDTSVVYSFSFPSVKAGNGRKISVWTMNGANRCIIHSAPSKTIDIPEGRTAYASFTLKPVQGSIYFTFSSIDPRIDTISTFFMSAAETLQAKGPNIAGNRILLSLDYIPDNSYGTVAAFGIDYAVVPPETLFSWQKSYLFRADCDSTLTAAFSSKPGTVGMDIALLIPGVTLVQGYMNSNPPLDTVQAGPLYISEIMYSADDSEYIEIHNPTTADIILDTLILEVNEILRKFPAVHIPANGFYVIGRQALPFANAWHPTKSALDLASTWEFIALRNNDGTLMDCVSFTGSANAMDWPVAGSSSKIAMVLNSLSGPLSNDLGKNWTLALTPIPSTGLKGTPGTAGR